MGHEDLAVEVAYSKLAGMGENETANACSRQRESGRAAHATDTRHQRGGSLELLLARFTKSRHR